MSQALHHVHKRKRIHLKKEAYPHPGKLKNFFDRLVYIVGILMPIFTIPQAWAIWSTGTAAGVSLTTWTANLLAAIVWLCYGVLHKEKPIIFMYILLAIINSAIVFGILIYS